MKCKRNRKHLKKNLSNNKGNLRDVGDFHNLFLHFKEVLDVHPHLHLHQECLVVHHLHQECLVVLHLHQQWLLVHHHLLQECVLQEEDSLKHLLSQTVIITTTIIIKYKEDLRIYVNKMMTAVTVKMNQEISIKILFKQQQHQQQAKDIIVKKDHNLLKLLKMLKKQRNIVKNIIL